jgi:hypothetical protein
MEGFADLLNNLLKAAWGDGWGTFTDQFPTGTTPEALPLPIITWDVELRIPSEAMKQHKQKRWDSVPDPDNPGEMLHTYIQWYDNEVCFSVWTKTSREAKALTSKLEDALLMYTGYFKEKGIFEMTFLSERPGGVKPEGRQDLAYRKLTYLIRTQHTTLMRARSLENITTEASVLPGNSPSIILALSQRLQ